MLNAPSPESHWSLLKIMCYFIQTLLHSCSLSVQRWLVPLQSLKSALSQCFTLALPWRDSDGAAGEPLGAGSAGPAPKASVSQECWVVSIPPGREVSRAIDWPAFPRWSVSGGEGPAPGSWRGLQQMCPTEAGPACSEVLAWTGLVSALGTGPWTGEAVSGELIQAAFKLQNPGALPSSQLCVRVGLA